MCLICTELSKGLITVKDAKRNAAEIGESITADHLEDLMDLIDQIEDKEDNAGW